MKCPICGEKLGVYRTLENKRYRKCVSCKSKFTTMERYRFREEEFDDLSDQMKKKLANEEENNE